jgi:hypothetical protein
MDKTTQSYDGKPSIISVSPNNQEYIFGLEKRIMILESELKRVSKETSELYKLTDDTDLRIPDTDLLSDNYLRRAFAVWGHYFIAQLLISIPIVLIYLAIFIAALNNL